MATPVLPAQPYYRIHELAAEWKISVEQVLRFAEFGMLPVSIRVLAVGMNPLLVEFGEVEPGEATLEGRFPRRYLAKGLYELLPSTVSELVDNGKATVSELFSGNEGMYCRLIASAVRGQTYPVITVEKLIVPLSVRLSFECSHNPEQQTVTREKPLNARAENNYLKLIAGLTDYILGDNFLQPYKAAEALAAAFAEKGIESPVAEQTLANYLQKARKLQDK